MHGPAGMAAPSARRLTVREQFERAHEPRSPVGPDCLDGRRHDELVEALSNDEDAQRRDSLLSLEFELSAAVTLDRDITLAQKPAFERLTLTPGRNDDERRAFASPGVRSGLLEPIQHRTLPGCFRRGRQQ